MEELYEMYGNTHYKSGWKPLAKEDGAGILTTYKNVAAPQKENTALGKTAETNRAAAVSEERDVWKVLSEISAKLDTLSDRVLEQNESMNRLIGLIEAKAAESKKGALGFWGK